MKSLVWVLIILAIGYFVFLVPGVEKENRPPPWNPVKREIIHLELNSQTWSEPVKAVSAGKCVFFQIPNVEHVTVQYKTTADSNWKFAGIKTSGLNNKKLDFPNNYSALRFRSVYSRGHIYYEVRPSGNCNSGILQGVGEDIKIKIVLNKNAWSSGVDMKQKQCIKWWFDRGKGIKVQFKHGKYDSWKGWPDQKKEYQGWGSTTWRFRPTIADGWVKYSLRPAGQCRD